MPGVAEAVAVQLDALYNAQPAALGNVTELRPADIAVPEA
jgi:hypothetical protein